MRSQRPVIVGEAWWERERKTKIYRQREKEREAWSLYPNFVTFRIRSKSFYTESKEILSTRLWTNQSFFVWFFVWFAHPEGQVRHHIKFGVKYKRKWCAWNERNRGRPTSRSLFEVVFLMLLARDRVFVNGMVIISSSFERMLLLLFFSISGTSLLIRERYLNID